MMSHGCTADHPLTEGSDPAMPRLRTTRFGEVTLGVTAMVKTAPHRAAAPGLRPHLAVTRAVSVELA